MSSREPFVFAEKLVAPGKRRHFDLPAGRLPSGTPLSLPIEVLCGVEAGPTVWLSGAIHGDEVVGVEIIRQVMQLVDAEKVAGTIIAAPVVNVFGFVTESRYLPDRRDLNRSFPGSERGPLAGRLARLFVDRVLSICDFGLDFHAGSDDRTNLAQIRCNLDDPETRDLAFAFAPPLVVHSKTIKGTLRHTALKLGKRVLLFEGGEPRRFSPKAVDAGVSGTLRVLRSAGMIAEAPDATNDVRESRNTKWVRASRGGIFRLEAQLGEEVKKGTRIGVIAGPAGRQGQDVIARMDGVILGHAVNPLVHQGDGLVHLAEITMHDGQR
ncbi:MAG: succinylglutamate desuccinylase/aspartoacylase family protein [Gemmatimonadetes bacterium]|nr:succinylglutamate desuccinylase/aspartoacylase family protein [Gemmatimonadota bacterium]NNL29925.1 succinylglutamate desuccinylase/aspartoacylase family protein [Gemmatimonadota bacterium]